MASRRVRAWIGVAMVVVGFVQIGLYATQHDWIPTVLGMFYAAVGVGYLWAEVYRTERDGEAAPLET
ncbi:hypothetical protein [Natrinema sp. 74]|uniref:hypothetical protein n=1 Tax=Natrinema sp. 74 TaxID=3384159 RepID=UPI0038D3DEDB